MLVDHIRVGLYKTNCYLIKTNDHLLMIDPGARAERILTLVENDTIDGILLTHGHLDHIGAVDAIVKAKHCPVYCSYSDLELLSDPKLNCSNQNNIRVNSKVIGIDEGEYQIGAFKVQVYATPGHTHGSLVFLIDDKLFTGDTLFKESVGRTDLPTGSDREMRTSLKLFKNFNPDTIIYPGHEEISTIGHELKYNPYMK